MQGEGVFGKWCEIHGSRYRYQLLVAAAEYLSIHNAAYYLTFALTGRLSA